MKFDPRISFNTTYVSKNEETIALTGLEGIDELNNLYNCTGITRLFEGEDNVLKLWYIFYFDTEEIYSAYEDYNSLTSYITDVDLVSLCEVGLEPNDPLFNSTDHKAFYDSKIPEAWDIETGNSNIIVGIIDLGLDWNHPDISIDNIWQNLGEDANNNGFTIYQDATGNIYFDSGDLNGIDDDGNGKIDDLAGYNFWQNNYNIIQISL